MKKTVIFCTFIPLSLFALSQNLLTNSELDLKLGINYPSPYRFSEGNYYLNSKTAQGYSFQIEAFKYFSEYSAFGAGIGFFSSQFVNNNPADNIIKETSNFDLVPLYLAYKQNFPSFNNFTPYFEARLGYTASLNHSSVIHYTGGIYTGASLGVKYNQFLAELQYNLGTLYVTNSTNTTANPPTYYYHAIGVALGLSFGGFDTPQPKPVINSQQVTPTTISTSTPVQAVAIVATPVVAPIIATSVATPSISGSSNMSLATEVVPVVSVISGSGTVQESVPTEPQPILLPTSSLPPLILFPDNNAILQNQYKTPLATFASKYTQANSSQTIYIAGFSSKTGNASYNQMMSQYRAQAVSRYLISQGIPKQNIVIQVFGENNSISSTNKLSRSAIISFEEINPNISITQ